jgi:predicted peroxiredoxin
MTPFVFAAVAAALDEPVEVFFTAGTVRLLVEGVAAACATTGTNPQTLYDTMREAHAAGARFYACSMAMQAYITPEDRLIPEFDGIRGVTTVLAESFEHDQRLLIF